MNKQRGHASTRFGRTLAGLLILASVLIVTSAPARAATSYTAVASGNWEDPATWGGTVPAFDGTITIPSGIAVTIAPGIGVVLNHATLTNAGFLFIGGILTVDDGTTVQNSAGGEVWSISGTVQLSSGSVGATADQAKLNNAGKFANLGGFVNLGVWTELNNTGTIYNDGAFTEQIRAEVHNRGTFENVGHVDTSFVNGVNGPTPSWFFNEGGTFDNSDSLAVLTVGGSFANSTSGFTSGHVINVGTIDVAGDSSHHGSLANVGSGTPTIDNYGVINVETNLVNNYASGDLIHNHSGAEINISGNDVHNLTGTLRNDNGATISIIGPFGDVENRAVIDNDGLISNGNVLDNFGVIRQRCNGLINGNPVSGNALQDWCDSTPPILNLPTVPTVEATGPNGAVVFFTATATDDKDPHPTVSCGASGLTFPLGTTTVVCTATDRVGNTRAGSFTVTVVDTTAPTLTVLGEPSVVVVVHNPYADAGATASDVVYGDLTASIQVTNTVDVNSPGVYSVAYAVQDFSGNTASASRTVTVISSSDATQGLIDDIGDLGLPSRATDDLRGPLARALKLTSDANPSNDRGACAQLQTFRDTVNRMLSRGSLTPAQAAVLLNEENPIRTAIGC